MPWARRQTKPIPSQSSREKDYNFDDYSLGYNRYVANDKMPNKSGDSNFWRLAQDARITTLGEYETRKGFDFFSDAAGETQDDTETSTTGAADQSFTKTTRLAQKFTTASAGILSKVLINLKNASSASGTVMVEIYSDDSSEPGTLLATSSVANSDIASTYAYETARFPDPPTLTTATDYWIVVYSTTSDSFSWSSTTNSTDALSSTDSGGTWSAESFSLNFQQYYSTTGGIKGLHRAYKSDGTAVTLFAHGTVLYSVNNSTGALTTVKSGLNASATHYRFITVNDTVYYVNGFDGYRKWDFTTESQVNSTNYTHIAEHKGLIFLVQKNDPNRIDFSNFADYETFTSTDFIYAPSPKTGDPVTALVSLNGFLNIFTRNRKFILFGSDNATFQLDEAPDFKGTYTQESVTKDRNFMYYLSDDGVYRSNGSDAELMSENDYENIKNIQTKENAVMQYHKGRIYLWYTPSGQNYNSECFVWNANYKSGSSDTIESFDTDATVARAFSGFNDDDLFVASSVLGQVHYQEKQNNDYTNLGGKINFLLQTHYNPFGASAVEKQVRYWKPRFEASDGDYTIDCDYAYDLRDNWITYQQISTQGSGATYGSGVEYGDGTVFGSTSELQGSLYVPGQYRRIAIRYKHYAARQPHTFLGHTIIVQQRRIR